MQNHFHHTIRKMAGWILVALMLLTGFAFTQDKSQALSKDKVITLLRQGTSSVRAQYLVGKYGVDFPFTSDTEQALKRAGADQELLDLIRRVAPPAVEAKPTPPPPPPLPVLIVNAKPGDAEVYVDDERHGQTSPDGTLRINGLVAGNHKIRISLPGYKSFEVAIELLAGQTHTVAAMLLPGTPPSAPAEKSPNSIENPSTTAATPPSIEKKPPPDLSDPLTPHEPGIYYFQENGKSRKLVLLDPVPASSPQAKAGRSAAMIGLGVSGKPHWKSTILGGQARVRSPERRPVFYFYFKVAGQDVTGSNIVFQNAAAPTEFILAHLESKKSEREIPNDGANYLGSSTNIRPKNAIAFTNERLAPGIYKVQPQSEMNAGEYGFMYGGSLPGVFMATSTWLFDFGVDKTK